MEIIDTTCIILFMAFEKTYMIDNRDLSVQNKNNNTGVLRYEYNRVLQPINSLACILDVVLPIIDILNINKLL